MLVAFMLNEGAFYNPDVTLNIFLFLTKVFLHLPRAIQSCLTATIKRIQSSNTWKAYHISVNQ